jgi:hypothetical protein
VTIPDSVTSIGDLAFYGCSLLTIYCKRKETEKPSNWKAQWNTKTDSSDCPVEWGYTDRGIVNDNVIWIEHEGKIKIIGY